MCAAPSGPRPRCTTISPTANASVAHRNSPCTRLADGSTIGLDGGLLLADLSRSQGVQRHALDRGSNAKASGALPRKGEVHAAHGKGSPRHCLPVYLPKTRAAQVTARAAKSKNSYTKNRVKVSRTPLYSQTNSAPAAGLHLHLSSPHAAAHYTYTRPKTKNYTLHFKQPNRPQ